MSESDVVRRCFSILREPAGKKVIEHLKKKFPPKFVPGDRDATYENQLKYSVIEYIEQMVNQSAKVNSGTDMPDVQ